MNVSAWLCDLGLGRYAEAFAANNVDAQTLAQLTDADLVDIGVKSVGHRRKIKAAVARFADSANTADTESSADGPGDAQPPTSQRAAERRQISVIYCGLDNSTTLSADLEPEDYRQLIRAFHQVCCQRVAEFDGWVANFLGDCVLAYFGWPQAHEDDAERSVRVGMAAAQAVSSLELPFGVTLAVRVGIATGLVVVGDLLQEGPALEQSAVGVTPNLGARLQTLAAPGQVVVDEATRRLVASSFTLRPLGQNALKGIREPVAAYVVTGERPVESRFEARHGQHLSSMVGRDHELALLQARWALARAGEGQAVLLVGEAGIGKSRLVRAMLDACEAEPHGLVLWQCLPHHTGSALWPVIQELGRTIGLRDEDDALAARPLEQRVAGNLAEASALYATLLGHNETQHDGPLKMGPQMLRERTLELLLERLKELGERQPLLLVVEDAHWIDPTTLEVLGRSLERIDESRLLVVITTRPDNQPDLGAHPSISRLSLNRLSRASVETLVAGLGGDSLQSHTMAAIVAQTDGVPLFVEELTKAVLETGEAAIPASLHGSLMARLDRVPDVKEVAQIAACIGREFDQALLQVVAERPETVGLSMDKLTAAELVFRRAGGANPRYIFKHALVQEAAYESMLHSKRKAIHARILQAMNDEQARTPYEILARHAEGAGQFDRAIQYWSQAGDAATAKSAYAEAAGFLDAAIALIRAQDDGEDRRALELELQLRLGQVRVATEGYGNPATLAAFERAGDLLRACPQSSAHEMRAQYGLWTSHHTRGDFKEHMLAAERVFAAGQACGDTASRGMGHRVLAVSLIYAGDLAQARHHLEQALSLLDPSQSEPAVVTQFGVNPEVAVHFFLGWTLCLLGFAARSRAMLNRSREIAGTLPQVNARALAHMHGGIAGVCAGDVESVRSDSERLRELCARHRMPMYHGYADAFAGWILLESGQSPHDAVTLLERGLSTLAQIGSRNYAVLFIAQLARALAALGRHDDARSTVERALVESQSRGIGWCDAELWRVRGDLLLRCVPPDRPQAIESFERALRIARARGAKLWELRAAVGLARLWAGDGETTNALNLLAPIYGWFTEGFDTVDLVAAKSLLEEIRHRHAQRK